MSRAVNKERFTLLAQDLACHQPGREFISGSKESLKFLGAIDLRPVDRWIACQNTKPKGFGQLEVDRADLIEKLLATR